jgi:hypothetical protein
MRQWRPASASAGQRKKEKEFGQIHGCNPWCSWRLTHRRAISVRAWLHIRCDTRSARLNIPTRVLLRLSRAGISNDFRCPDLPLWVPWHTGRCRESEMLKARSSRLCCTNLHVYLISSERYRSYCAGVVYSLFILWTEAWSLFNQQDLQQLSPSTFNRSAWQRMIPRTVEMRLLNGDRIGAGQNHTPSSVLRKVAS